MKTEIGHGGGWYGMPPWLILGAVIVLAPLFIFWTHQNINKQKENTIFLLLEKGAALIRSFEAGTRTGMMGMMGMRGERFQLQRLLMETAQQSDIAHLIVTDLQGNILAHSDPSKIGEVHGSGLDLEGIHRSESLQWRQLGSTEGGSIFEVFRHFLPKRPKKPKIQFFLERGGRGGRGNILLRPPKFRSGEERVSKLIIFVGLDMTPIEAARKADTRHTVIMGVILLLIGFAGIFLLFLAQAYRSAKHSLTRIKAFSDHLVENMPIGLVAVDMEGDIISFNQTAEALFGLPAREVLGRQAADILPESLWSLTRAINGHSKTALREVECPMANGRRVPLDVSVSVLEGEGEAAPGYIILFKDMTEVQDLKREVERNQRLASLGRLAAGIAHEIRNPLSSIKGFATYFKERYREIPEDQKTADIMVQEVERLNRVISQLLEFARPVTVKRRPISLETMIKHSLRMIERDAEKRHIRIHTELSDKVGELSIDPDRMNQVFLNLYLNAMEAMADGGSLSVTLSREETSNGIKIVVSDTGKGIPKEDLEHIFDPYFTTKPSGTGLGLAIVHKIIESHHGELRVVSEPGKGSHVEITLPYPSTAPSAIKK